MSEHVATIEEAARGQLSMAGVLNLHISCCHLLLHLGSERQRRQLRPQMASGDLRAAISLSEPHAGSDYSLPAMALFLASDEASYVNA